MSNAWSSASWLLPVDVEELEEVVLVEEVPPEPLVLDWEPVSVTVLVEMTVVVEVDVEGEPLLDPCPT